MAESSYDAKTTTTTQQSSTIRLHPEYARTIPGILKIIEIVLSLITFICSVATWWSDSASGWVEFVSMSAFLSTLIFLILHLLNLISRFPGPWLLIEFIYYIVFAVFFLIAAIVAAAKAGLYRPNVGACAFFAFAATAVYAVDTFFQYRAWSTGQAEMSTRTTTTSTAVTVESGRNQY